MLLVVSGAIAVEGCSLLVSSDALHGGGSPQGDAAPSDGGAAGANADGSMELPTPLLYYYASGDLRDESGRRLDGRLRGNARVDAAGVRGSALACSGALGEAFVIGGELAPGTGSVTVALFFKLSPAASPNGGFNSLFTKGCAWENSTCNVPGFGMGVIASSSPKLIAYAQDSATQARYTSTSLITSALTDDRFQHVSFVVDRPAAELRLYLDGMRRSMTALRSDFGSRGAILHEQLL